MLVLDFGDFVIDVGVLIVCGYGMMFYVLVYGVIGDGVINDVGVL